MNLYEFLTQKNRVEILTVKNYLEGREAKQVFDYLQVDTLLLPEFGAEEFDDLRSYRDEIFDILNSLDRYYQDKTSLIIPEITLKQPLPSKRLRKGFDLSFGEKFTPSQLRDKLIKLGYRDSGIVQNRGEFSLHTNRLDIYPINSPQPFRVSFSQDFEIEEIRGFSPLSQIREDIDEVETIYIPPALFQVSDERYREIEEDIEDSDINGLSLDVVSYGLWFLKEGELFYNKSVKNLYNYSTLPKSKKLYDLEFEELQKRRQSYQKTNILLDELSVGDYVVHQEHGIGVFEKLTKERILGGYRDFIKIKYFGDNHLLLPIEKLDLLTRYISATGKTPQIDKLGKGGFFKKSGKVREKLSAVARYIVELSAKRRVIQAPKIESINLSQLQKSAGFRYTDDQIESIDTVLSNLRLGYPMDHLLIGDVGFGKTEVAINILYTVIKNGFQVAFIVPTTLLAKQHFTTINDRLKNFNIRIAHMDSFIKGNEKKSIKNGVENGEIDLIIGTHAILDFKFKNLALLIIDEEHKFGVKQKSKLQESYSNIHLLSMSATPIPRTLHSALSQLKTFSRLETPPKERIGVRTFLKEYDEVVIKSAILKELKRGGQIFYIFNSIAEIENKRVELLNILPHLKILILHSKISPKVSEEEIINFEKGEYDILLSTSIVSSGIHLPNVNTILIDGADRFGVADLHQLRGRVGRGEREGFCYFFVEDIDKLGENASKRLLALEENSSLGSGNLLAMHDLEIRGGGNIAGESQSGHIDDVGYSLYVKMLESEIKKLTIGNIEDGERDIDIQLSVDGYISEDLIPEERVRLELYRRATSLSSLEEIDKIESEIRDRFGEVDTPTSQFLDILKIKILGGKLKIVSIRNVGKNITISFQDDRRLQIQSPTKDDDDILETTLNYLSRL